MLDRAWHEAALLELLRVAAEVRVFPLVVQGSGAAVPFLPDLLGTLPERGCGVRVEAVEYEFQRGADRNCALAAGRAVDDTCHGGVVIVGRCAGGC